MSHGNTFVYGYDFRRVKVAQDTLQVFPRFRSGAFRGGARGRTQLYLAARYARQPRGRTSGQLYQLSGVSLGKTVWRRGGVQSHRHDRSSYYGFDKDRFIIARNTRYGEERAFGTGSSELIPLPERLYAGGATSLRSFSINAAGPRDPDTGFPLAARARW